MCFDPPLTHPAGRSKWMATRQSLKKGPNRDSRPSEETREVLVIPEPGGRQVVWLVGPKAGTITDRSAARVDSGQDPPA